MPFEIDGQEGLTDGFKFGVLALTGALLFAVSIIPTSSHKQFFYIGESINPKIAFISVHAPLGRSLCSVVAAENLEQIVSNHNLKTSVE